MKSAITERTPLTPLEMLEALDAEAKDHENQAATLRASQDGIRLLLKSQAGAAATAITATAIRKAVTLKSMRVADLAEHFGTTEEIIMSTVKAGGSQLEVGKAGWVQDLSML